MGAMRNGLASASPLLNSFHCKNGYGSGTETGHHYRTSLGLDLA
ncbi:hypothetical protein Mal15_35570 [Stieleria maiorica]|uniref:Uncharacterized protein n=1 Tax=Stieleria maiorica TaxID=2795974 RepID=A0A5B9ME06_9BACT|nr:hypothetical protein Mal15_35570 [Stieleria maiorica]